MKDVAPVGPLHYAVDAIHVNLVNIRSNSVMLDLIAVVAFMIILVIISDIMFGRA